MITLVDTYDRSSWDLHYSLLVSGYKHPMIAINDDGFLPEDVTSPYLYYTGYDQATGTPLYFNQVPVQDCWEIWADSSHGEILNYQKKQGYIHYAEPSHLRHVKAVDWYDEQGRIRITDRYNRVGARHAQSIYNVEGQMILTTYYNQSGQEVIVENHQTGDILLNHDQQVKLFHSRHAFVSDFLQTAGYDLDRILYNSLSTPFLVAYYLGQPGEDILFWQEGFHGEVPGNMQLLLTHPNRSTRILVQNRQTYDQLSSLMTAEEQQKVAFLGYQYPFTTSEKSGKDVLILTNSDQLEQIDSLVNQHPDLDFHIAALTEMSTDLMRLAAHHHVHLYQNVDVATVQNLLRKCSVYLDINHFDEILAATRSAFEHQLVILAFAETQHGVPYTAPEHVFQAADSAGLSRLLGNLTASAEIRATALEEQKSAANLETAERYRQLIG